MTLSLTSVQRKKLNEFKGKCVSAPYYNEVDENRKKNINIHLNLIKKYSDSQIDVESFKTEIDSINKKENNWGFKGMSGQMFFNMLYNSSFYSDRFKEFEDTLKEVIKVPVDLKKSKEKIERLATFINSLWDLAIDKRTVPKQGSICFFLSFFWHLQNNEEWPIFYNASKESLENLGLFSTTGDIIDDYELFYNLNNFLKKELADKNGKNISNWLVEHILWELKKENQGFIEDQPEVKKTSSKKEVEEVYELLPSSFIPSVVSILPDLGINKKTIQEACKNSNISVAKAFEERISIAFNMIGFAVEPLGQGKGRRPDGIAVCNQYNYAVLFDAKSREDGYSIGTDDRAIKEYIKNESESLKRRFGVKHIYFVVISSYFKGDFDNVIRNLKMETDIREVILLEASCLLTILERKLRDSANFSLGQNGIQNIFAQSGIITNEMILEFFDK